MANLILIRYEEIALKGRNRYLFENRLVSHVKRLLCPLGDIKVKSLQCRMLIDIGDIDRNEVFSRLKTIFGIASFSPVIQVDAEEEIIYQTAKTTLLEALKSKGVTPGQEEVSYRVTVKRADKKFPIGSMELASRVGSYLMTSISGLTVDLHNPQMVVSVDIRHGLAYIFSETIAGAGGLPVGSNGKGMLLLSGGIDSPVAGWMAMKRGVSVEAVHFYSFPFTGEKSKEKVKDLCQVLAKYNYRFILHVVHFTEIQKAIHKQCPESLRITVMRRFMFRIAQRIAKKNEALALVTGESVGQVSSQTLENMAAINEVTLMPVLRPLVAFDKSEIMSLAHKIDTFDISIRPHEDCCTLFLPKGPVTVKPHMDKIIKVESLLDMEALIEEALEKTEVLSFVSR